MEKRDARERKTTTQKQKSGSDQRVERVEENQSKSRFFRGRACSVHYAHTVLQYNFSIIHTVALQNRKAEKKSTTRTRAPCVRAFLSFLEGRGVGF